MRETKLPDPSLANVVCANAERFSGFAVLYDMARPTTPVLITDLLQAYLESGRASSSNGPIVVDVGCGTGLSTLIWQGRCAGVTGVDPSTDMLALATEKARKLETNEVRFIQGDSTHLPFGDSSTDIVTCSQSFHWMEPNASLAEFHRVLVHGGVFAAFDCDWPPSIGRESEMLYRLFLERAEKIASERAIQSESRKWHREKHLDDIRASGLFQFSKEIVFHSVEQCDAEHFIAIALSQSQLQELLKAGVNETELDLHSFRAGVHRALGESPRPMYLSYRMQIAVK